MTIQANASMPKPDALVSDEHGNVMAAMFYFAPGEYYGEVAEMCGFECKTIRMEDQVSEDDPIWARYSDGEDITNLWDPVIPDGWTFGDKSDTEDGPSVILIRPLPAPDLQ